MRNTADAKVIATNDDAQISKLSCVQLGYFKDDFVHLFVRRPTRRSPLINRGYYSRYAAIRSLIAEFLSQVGSSPCQILSIGAGFDTAFFQLTKEALLPETLKYIELDFNQVVSQKTAIIANTPLLRQYIKSSTECEDGITSDTYCLHSADIRHTEQLESGLNASNWNPALPTLVIAECVLVYLQHEEGSRALEWVSTQLTGPSACIIYEQVNPNDAFGRQMMTNLQCRGCPLHGIIETLDAHSQRLVTCGWTSGAVCKSMHDVYKDYIDQEDKKRIERLEIFDEFEEWDLIQQHYCIAVGTVNDDDGVLQGLLRL